ncbi:sugar kinase [Auraticoccus monumenti]|uniref:2-dehydro-3-deoxygluconokinase n=1 Tax=Auraticoccus monumenti TaxID=675864 RepID=A0A1G6S922_9ACTN|nr:sugar kinase [Auraticoccus monumenti]SDD13164.1 2-dehydro-3-deoxygluconokinase [Auraticoccus monumenti]
MPETDTTSTTAPGDVAGTSTDLPEVVCLGETMVLITPVDAVPLDQAEDCRIDVGGAESTVALYLTESGRRAAWVSRLGDDPLGRRVLRYLDRLGVDTRWVATTSTAPTGVYFKDPAPGRTAVHYYRKGSAASTMGPEVLDDLPLDSAAVVHVSGINPALSDSVRALVEALVVRVAGTSTLLSFDVNYRPGLWPVEEAGPLLLDLVRRADLALVGRDEAEVLWGTTTAESVAELVGPGPVLVVKDGDVGATEIDGDQITFAPATRVDVVEAVGAGDAFAAGYLDALLAGAEPAARLARGHALAVRALASTRDFAPLVRG